eukprot:GCRY01004352.1.p1 GENE.GCRY01004352.1~~GCRY01004352.1.p1  ORF type:complete len:254 (-),score=32.61 GCRY01004352.1:36-797(-)
MNKEFINIDRLISHCQALGEKHALLSHNDKLKFKQFLVELRERINKLDDLPQNEDKIKSYKKQTSFLESLKQDSTDTPINQEDFLPLITRSISDCGADLSPSTQSKKEEITQVGKEASKLSVRQELFQTREGISIGELRQRQHKPSTKDEKLALMHEQETQEEITNDLLDLTSVLKQQSLQLNRFVNKDLEVLEQTEAVTQQNLTTIKKENSFLDSLTKKSSSNFWTSITMVLFVCMTFFTMWVFMKAFPKRK